MLDLRIKIWNKSSGDAIVCDTQMGASDEGNSIAALGSGSIIIHK